MADEPVHLRAGVREPRAAEHAGPLRPGHAREPGVQGMRPAGGAGVQEQGTGGLFWVARITFKFGCSGNAY